MKLPPLGTAADQRHRIAGCDEAVDVLVVCRGGRHDHAVGLSRLQDSKVGRRFVVGLAEPGRQDHRQFVFVGDSRYALEQIHEDRVREDVVARVWDDEGDGADSAPAKSPAVGVGDVVQLCRRFQDGYPCGRRLTLLACKGDLRGAL